MQYLIVIQYLAFLALFSLMYTLNIPSIEKYKANNEPWPWDSNPNLHKQEMKKMLKRTLINIVIIGPGLGLLFFKLGFLRMSLDFKQLPTISEFLFQFGFCFLMADFVFYWVHRLLHHPSLYQYWHKTHHESKNTVAMSALYVHPVEYILADGLTSALGIMLMGTATHEIVLYTFILWQGCSNIDDHCGYDFPWMFTKIFPWSASNVFHNYHHLLNIGNFSAHMVWWDSIFATNIEFLEHFEQQEKLKTDKREITRIRSY